MKNNILTIVGFLSIILLSGCFAPMNTVYESARTPNAGEFELSGNYSHYYPFWVDTVYLLQPTNRNYGGSLAFGLSDNFSMKFRYERMNVESIQFWDIKIREEGENIDEFDYFEIGGKLALWKDHIALSLPVGMYRNGENNMTTMNPRLFLTLGGDKFEFSVIPKATILFGEDEIIAIPGATIGFGFSNDLNKWAIRPEIGFDGLFVNAGIGINYQIPTMKKDPVIYNPLYK